MGVASGEAGVAAAPRALTLAPPPQTFLVFASALPVIMLDSRLPNKYLLYTPHLQNVMYTNCPCLK